MEEELKTVQNTPPPTIPIVSEPHSKPSFTKKQEEQNKAEIKEKDEQITNLTEKLDKMKKELNEQKEANKVLKKEKDQIENELKSKAKPVAKQKKKKEKWKAPSWTEEALADDGGSIFAEKKAIRGKQVDKKTLYEKASLRQKPLTKKELEKEKKLLKEKDEGFINKIYKERDEYKSDMIQIKKAFKEREYSFAFSLFHFDIFLSIS